MIIQSRHREYNITPNQVLRFFIGVILSIVIASGILFYFWGINLLNHLPRASLCPFYAIFTKPCPGCGVTRAFLYIGQLKIRDALQSNPFSIPLLLTMAVYLFLGYAPSWLQHRILVRSALCVILMTWLIRLFYT